MEEFKTSNNRKIFRAIFWGSLFFYILYLVYISTTPFDIIKFSLLVFPALMHYYYSYYNSSKIYIYENGAIKLQIGLFKKIIEIEKDEIQHITIYNSHGRFTNPIILIKYYQNYEVNFQCQFGPDTMVALKDSLKKYYADRMTYYVDGFEQYF